MTRVLDQKLISVHTPKASGTSIIAALRQHFGELLEIDNLDDPANPLSQRVMDPQAYFSRKRRLGNQTGCLHGHFHPGQFDLEGVGLFTMLRHPVDNIISIYHFWKSIAPHGNPLHDYFINSNMSILNFAHLPAIRYLYTDRYFGNFDMKKFNLIGRFENRDFFFDRLYEMFGLKIDASIRLNVSAASSDRFDNESNPDIIANLRNILKDDILFYEKYSF